MIIDTHTHLYLDEFAPDKDAAVTRAIDSGVGHMVFPNVDLTTIAPMKDLQSHFPGNISLAMGMHPTEIDSKWAKAVDVVGHELFSNRSLYVAIGEIGIDLYWDKTYRDEQMQAFERQVDWASELGLPVIIHCREGLNETLEVLEGKKGVNGVFHSFGGSKTDVEAVRKRAGDFYFGINGIVTFKNSRLRDVLPVIGIDRLLLETDSPYLAPVPHRGRRNESAYIVHTCAHVAEALGIDKEEAASLTTVNACRLFNIG